MEDKARFIATLMLLKIFPSFFSGAAFFAAALGAAFFAAAFGAAFLGAALAGASFFRSLLEFVVLLFAQHFP